METVIIVIHLMVVLAMIVVVLLQRSEGGALGIGGGGGGGLMTARGAANALTRTTAILAVCFFATSITLTVMARVGGTDADILDQIPIESQTGAEGGILDQLREESGAPAAPATNQSGVPTTQ